MCPEPSGRDPQSCALEIAHQINRGLEALQSSYAPHVVLVFYPERWAGYSATAPSSNGSTSMIS